MLVYKDIISGDELCTDAYERKPLVWEGEVVEGLMEIESRMQIKGAENVDIGCGDAFGGGGEDDGPEGDSVEKVNDVIEAFKLQELPFDSKAQFKDYLKDYVRAVRSAHKEKGTPQEEIKAFMAQAPDIVKFLLTNSKEIDTYMGESMDAEGAMVYSYYKEGALTPTFFYIKFGLLEEKF